MKIITGMHRSGTSLVARIFLEAGAGMGDPDTFYRPDRWNPEGYYERPEVHAINMPLLNGPFGRLSYFRLPSVRTVRRRGRRLETRIAAVAQEHRLHVLKDPRFCITMPAWRDAGAVVEGVLVCLRDPISVAGSLLRRNRALRSHSYYLWREHNQRVLESADGIPTWFLYYPNLLSGTGWDQEMQGALAFFGIETDPETRSRLREATVKPSMNHHPAASIRYPAKVERLWNALLQRHRQQFQ